MSFITRCSACGTAFKVVADQLKIADGWVRCGHCQQVFDATQDLQPMPARVPAAAMAVASAPESLEPTPAVPVPSIPPISDPWPVAPPEPPAASMTAAVPQTEAALPPFPALIRDDTAAGSGGLSAAPVEAASLSPVAADVASSTEKVSPPGIGRGADVSTPRETESGAPRPGGEPESPVSAECHPPATGSLADGEPRSADAESPSNAARPAPAVEPSFVRQARRRAFWRRPLVRAALALVALGLTVLLAAQAAWHWRDTWAAQYPWSRPWLQAFCARTGCTVALPRRPADVVIEGSVLLRRAPDRYSFHLVVRNRTDVEVAAPALELTLTDANGAVLARRVWMPDAWPQPTDRLTPGAEWPLQFELAFDHPHAARMTGYQAELFYP